MTSYGLYAFRMNKEGIYGLYAFRTNEEGIYGMDRYSKGSLEMYSYVVLSWLK